LTPEAERFLAKARECLADARLYQAQVPRIARREAYLSAYHAAEALIHNRTGKVAKRHRGFAQNLPVSPEVIRRSIARCPNSLRKLMNLNRLRTMAPDVKRLFPPTQRLRRSARLHGLSIALPG
jgi:hypothetical protein